MPKLPNITARETVARLRAEAQREKDIDEKNKVHMSATALRKSRHELLLTQRRMARFLGVPYPTYVNWEQGRRAVPQMVVRMVRLALRD